MRKRTALDRSENMRRIRSQDTAPEMAVRSLAFALGYRYRVHCKDIPGKPDLVFYGRHKAIFIHGCFWHQHPGCKEGRLPKSNLDYWAAKMKRNAERDRAVLKQLKSLGWETLVIWECEIKKPDTVRHVLMDFLGPPCLK